MSKSGKLNKFYQNNQLVTEISDDVQRSVFRGQGRFLGHLASGDERTPSVSAVDGENTVMAEPQANCLARFAYTPYGDRARLNEPDTPWAYHGERLDGLSGGYALGNGYRLYRPGLMRFGAPDNMSPFGLGELNAYAYCLGDPINHSDPSGHFALARLLRFAAPVMMGTTLVAGTALVAAGAVYDDKALYQAAAGVSLGGLALSGLLSVRARLLTRLQARPTSVRRTSMRMDNLTSRASVTASPYAGTRSAGSQTSDTSLERGPLYSARTAYGRFRLNANADTPRNQYLIKGYAKGYIPTDIFERLTVENVSNGPRPPAVASAYVDSITSILFGSPTSSNSHSPLQPHDLDMRQSTRDIRQTS